MIDSKPLAFITPDGIKLYLEADHYPHDNYIVDLVRVLRSDFSAENNRFQRDFGVSAEDKYSNTGEDTS